MIKAETKHRRRNTLLKRMNENYKANVKLNWITIKYKNLIKIEISTEKNLKNFLKKSFFVHVFLILLCYTSLQPKKKKKNITLWRLWWRRRSNNEVSNVCEYDLLTRTSFNGVILCLPSFYKSSWTSKTRARTPWRGGTGSYPLNVVCELLFYILRLYDSFV